VTERTLADPQSGSTLRDVRLPDEHRGRTVARRVVVLLLVAVVLLGASGMLGVHSATATATGGGWTMNVEYPWVARAGLDIPWTVTITAPPSGFPGQVTLEVTSDWFDLFETQGLSPQPTDETTDDTFDVMTFSTPPAGDTMTVSYDAYVQPAAQVGSDADVRLVVDGQVVASLHYRTWLLP
jgi:hypothetical protein